MPIGKMLAQQNWAITYFTSVLRSISAFMQTAVYLHRAEKFPLP